MKLKSNEQLKIDLNKEATELKAKIDRLVNFTKTKYFIDMVFFEKSVFLRQHTAMIEYHACLKERLNALEKVKTVD